MTFPTGKRFPTTHWSLVLAARNPGSAKSTSALATLCEAYWAPVYAFIRFGGRSPDQALDLTQGFFARVIEKNYFKDADATRGRFRTFLLSSVRHYLANEYDRVRAKKRGGTIPHLSLDIAHEERQYHLEPVERDTPERLYERRWAQAVLESAMKRLSEQYSDARRRPVFERLRPLIAGDDPTSYAELAAELKMSEGALRVAMHRLRKTFANCLREVVAETVADPAAVDDELRHLMKAVGR